jgi:Tfp pilus assembly protein PilX
VKDIEVERLASDRRGFALVTVILVIAVLATLVAAGFATLGGERRVSDDIRAQADAFSVAQGGIEDFFANHSGMPDSIESTTISVAGGVAEISMVQVRTDPADGRNGYIVWSHGVSTRPRLTGTVQAERTVAQYAVWRPGSMNVLASWTSLSGVQINGGSATIDGHDECGEAADLPGVVVPKGGWSGKSKVVDGDPPVDDTRTKQQLLDDVNIDWQGLTDGSALPPGTIIVKNTSKDWPSFSDPEQWPVIFVDGDLTLPKGGGQGLLIVTGNLTSNGTNQWKGIVLVGKDFTGNGTKEFHGAMVTGLNAKLPPPKNANAGSGDTGNGTKHIVYNSCDVASTLAHLGALVPLSNAWVDNWPSYTY